MNDDHIPVPLEHKPDVESHVEGPGISLEEPKNSEAYIYSSVTMEIEQ